MVFNEATKHLHFEMPKTASGTIHIHSRYAGYTLLNMHANITQLRKNYPNVYADAMKENGWLISCILRNPWDHAVSYYYHVLDEKRFFRENFFNIRGFFALSKEEALNNDLSFLNFLKTSYITNRSQTVKLEQFVHPYDNLINRFINYNNKTELNNFLKRFKVTDNSKKVHNKSSIKTVIDIPKYDDFRKYYGEEEYKLIEHHCKKEIDIFDYKF